MNSNKVFIARAAMAVAVGKTLDEYEHDAKIVINRPPSPLVQPYFEGEMSRKERRAMGAKKLRLKGLRP